MKVLVSNRYFPKSGKQKEVYALRRQASTIREKIGAPRGQVFQETSGKGEMCVVWTCTYISADARKRDVERVKGSEEFTKVRAKMDPLLKRFNRTVKELE